MKEHQESIVGDASSAEAAEEMAGEEVLFAQPSSLAGSGRATRGALVFEQAFEHVDRGSKVT